MKAEDLGYNPETGSHSAAFTGAEAAMMGILADHIGKDERISANELAWRYFVEAGEEEDDRRFRLEPWKRNVRYMVNHLVIDHDQAIMSAAGPKGGYWIAASKEEMDAFYGTFRKRALTGLTKAARGKKAVLVSMVKQLAFEFDEQGDRPAIVRPFDTEESAPMAVVTAFLDRMTREPEHYAHEIRLLRDKFGKVLMPREDFVKIQELSKELSGLLEKVS